MAKLSRLREHEAIFFGRDDDALCRQVTQFAAQALRTGGAAIIIAASAHEKAVRSQLHRIAIDPGSEAAMDRLQFLNAHEIVNSLFVDGELQSARFLRLVGAPVRSLCERYRVCVYGEMAGILRASEKTEAAIQLERMWNALLEEVPFRLLCGYPIDVRSKEFRSREMEAILSTHGTFGSTLHGLSRGISEAEATFMWLRQHLGDYADDAIEYAKRHGAPQSAEQSDGDPGATSEDWATRFL